MKRSLHPKAGLLALVGLLPVLVAIGTFLGCADRTDIAGVEGGNTKGTVAGIAVNPEGFPVDGARVTLVPYAFLRQRGVPQDVGLLQTTLTSADGSFRFPQVDTGSYRLEVNDGSFGALKEIDLYLPRQHITLGKTGLQPVASVQGKLAEAQRLDLSLFDTIEVSIRGLDHVAVVDPSTGSFEFAALPAGRHELVVATNIRTPMTEAAKAERYSASPIAPVNLQPGDALELSPVTLIAFASEDYALWPHRKSITLNTTSSGVPMTADQADFPLLLHLDRENIPFHQTVPDGRDLRFSDAQGKRLAYEVEHWNAVDGEGVVWVLLDTLHSNSMSQSVILHWGNAMAPDFSNGEAVFGAAGYHGVWHMSEMRNGLFANAAGSAHWGRSQGREPPRPVHGIHGIAQGFEGASAIGLGTGMNKALVDTFTISLWVRLKDVISDRYYRVLTGKRSFAEVPGFELEINPRHLIPGRAEPETYYSFWGTQRSSPARAFHLNWTQDQWYHLTAVVMGTAVHLYRDGMRVNPKAVIITPLLPAELELRLGGWESDFFQGAMEELRIHPQAFGPERVRVLFNNEAGDGLWSMD